jgi:RsiW-degrading membrane proteinase PrsW (M82 family)
MNLMKKYLLLLCFLPTLALADNPALSIGQIALNLVDIADILTVFVGSASIILGICALFAALLRYLQYRVNPLASPLSTVVLLFILGIVLLFLPYTYKLTGSGIPFSLS